MIIIWHTSLSSSRTLTCGLSNCLGHSVNSLHSHSEPSHHKVCCKSSEGKRPLEAQSAGLSTPIYMMPSFWWYWINYMGDTISHTSLKPSGAPCDPSKDNRAICPGIHIHKEIRNVFFTWGSKSARRQAPHSSKQGMVRCLIGATFVLKSPRIHVPFHWSQPFASISHLNKQTLKHRRNHEVVEFQC